MWNAGRVIRVALAPNEGLLTRPGPGPTFRANRLRLTSDCLLFSTGVSFVFMLRAPIALPKLPSSSPPTGPVPCLAWDESGRGVQ